MKVLLAMNLPYTLISGGANKSNKTLCEELVSYGVEVRVVTPAFTVYDSSTASEFTESLNRFKLPVRETGRQMQFRIRGVNIHAVLNPEELNAELKNEIVAFDPDWIFISSEDPSQQLLKAAHEVASEKIIYLAHTPQMLPFGPESLYPGEKRTALICKSKAIVTISNFVATYIKRYCGYNAFVNHLPHYGSGELKYKPSRSNKYILMVNPCLVKGISIMVKLAQVLPQFKFAVVPGWGTTSADKLLLETLDNVDVIANTSDLDQLFKDVSLLLMPSIWEEGFGMIVVDALIRGVPVISSDRGGLTESKLGTNYKIAVKPITRYTDKLDENYFPIPEIPDQDTSPWKEAILELLSNEDAYVRESSLSRQKALEFNNGLSVNPLLEYLSGLIDKNIKEAEKSKQLYHNLTPEQKDRVLKRFKEEKNTNIQNLRTINPIGKLDYYDVSSSQRQLLILNEINKEFYGFVLGKTFELTGEIDLEALTLALSAMTKRHEAFRTRFIKIDGEYKQEILDQVNLDLNFVRLDDRADFNETYDQIIKKMYNDKFELQTAPLLRTALIQIEDNKFLFAFTMHHIISDGESVKVFVRDLLVFYNNFLSKRESNLVRLRIQYKDFVYWRERYLTTRIAHKRYIYWQKRLSSNIQPINLPFDYTRPHIKTYKGASKTFKLSQNQVERVKVICKRYDTTFFITLLSYIKILLYRYTGQDNLIVGIPVSGRNVDDLIDQIGNYVNLIPIQSKINGKATYESFLADLRQTCIEAYDNEYPFDKLTEELNYPSDPSRSPIFDVMVSMTTVDSNSNASTVSSVSDINKFNEQGLNHGSSHDLAFILSEDDDDCSITIIYNIDLFREETICSIGMNLITIIDNVTLGNDISIDDIDLLNPVEKELVLKQVLSRNVNFPSELLIQEQFEKIAQEYPDNIACKYKSEYLTYRELNIKANRLAHRLREEGIGANDVVAIMTDESLETFISIIGVLKAGGAYLSIDIHFPPLRILSVLEQSKCKIVLTCSFDKGPVEIIKQFKVLRTVDVVNSSNDSVNPVKINTSTDLAYIIYTSGSTGPSKGVQIQHNNVIRLFFNDSPLFSFSERDRWTLFHSFNFDFSVWEMYGALLFGGQIIIVPHEVKHDELLFLKLLIANEVTVLNQVPGAFYNLIHAISTISEGNLALRYVILGGDSLQPEKLRAWKERFPLIKLVNMYGITETTVHVTYKEISNDCIDNNLNNIGKPIPTTGIYILDRNLKLQPKGVIGELYISGEGVSRGYLRNKDLTDKKFLKSPFKPGELIYSSGDLGRYLPNWDIEFIGRNDSQIQLRGYRIELKEIQYRMNQYPHVLDSIIIPHELNHEIYICAYIVSDSKLNYFKKELLDFLNDFLPPYMIPYFIIEIDNIPLTANGKIDKKALPFPLTNALQKKITVPQNATEQTLLEIWRKVLIDSDFGVEDDFFLIGGHSLKATKVLALVHKEFNIDLKLGAFFDNPTIRGVANIILKYEMNEDQSSNEIEITI